MRRLGFNRRDFHRLSMAAFGGFVAGSVPGCGGGDAKPEAGKNAAENKETASGDPALASAADVHVCHGLNACKGQGVDGKNACAGQGTCATKSTHHSCGEQNACKGQGGCGEDAGNNACKAKGGCHVPLMEGAWKGARQRFEEKMKTAGKEFGADPGKAKGATE